MNRNETNDDAIREGEPPYSGNTDSTGGTRPNMGDAEPAMKDGRAAPVWNTISLSAPFLGFVCGVVAGMCAPHMQWGEWGFRVWLGFGAGGLLAGVISLIRAERLWGVTVSGFVLNLAVLAVSWDMGVHGR